MLFKINATYQEDLVSDLKAPYSWILQNLPTDRPTVILFRHTSRPTNQDSHNAETLSSDIGLLRAAQLGAVLKQQLGEQQVRLYSSEVERCQETLRTMDLPTTHDMLVCPAIGQHYIYF